MKRDDYAPATQVQGWLRSLCDQNQPTLMRETCRIRVSILERPRELIDLSVTQHDRDSAEMFYHRAFWKFAFDQMAAGPVKMALLTKYGSIIEAPVWVFDPTQYQGMKSEGQAFRRPFNNFDLETLTVLEPDDLEEPRWGGRGIYPNRDRKIFEDKKKIFEDKKSIVHAEMLWPKADLPSLEDLLPYALLPKHYVPEPPIDRLKEDAEKGLTPFGEALMGEAQRQSGLRSDAARFLARGCDRWDEPRWPKKGEWPDVIEAFRKAFKDHQEEEEPKIRRYFNRAWKGAGLL